MYCFLDMDLIVQKQKVTTRLWDQNCVVRADNHNNEPIENP